MIFDKKEKMTNDMKVRKQHQPVIKTMAGKRWK